MVERRAGHTAVVVVPAVPVVAECTAPVPVVVVAFLARAADRAGLDWVAGSRDLPPSLDGRLFDT